MRGCESDGAGAAGCSGAGGVDWVAASRDWSAESCSGTGADWIGAEVGCMGAVGKGICCCEAAVGSTAGDMGTGAGYAGWDGTGVG